MKEVWGLNNALEYIENNEVDHSKYPYKGFILEVKRHPFFGHINGYIDFEHANRYTKEQIIEAAEENFYFGISFETDSVIGFDCNHFRDMAPYSDKKFMEARGAELLDSTATYKTFDFVESILKQTVDAIVGVSK